MLCLVLLVARTVTLGTTFIQNRVSDDKWFVLHLKGDGEKLIARPLKIMLMKMQAQAIDSQTGAICRAKSTFKMICLLGSRKT